MGLVIQNHRHKLFKLHSILVFVSFIAELTLFNLGVHYSSCKTEVLTLTIININTAA